jgi:1,4-dihydroxy-2-naphthoyl-CoA synthase
MQATFVTRHDTQGLATLTLNRPEKLNALSPESFVALRAHLDAIATDETIGCVLLQGAGRSFCAGHDLSTISAEMDEAFAAETIDALAQLPQPTIARIHGHCLTGGLELALGCDILIAEDAAKLGDTHGQWGLVPVWGMSVRLPQRVGRARAKELMFTSRRITGRQALDIGLVDHCLPQAELDTAIASLVAEILANSSGTNRIVKALVAAGDKRNPAEALKFERELPYGVPSDMSQRMGRAL